MSDDLIAKLRQRELRVAFGSDRLMTEAADEITRLRARLEQAERERNAALGEATGFSVRDYHDGKEAGFRAGIEAAAERIESIGFSAGLIRALAEQKEDE